MDSSSATEPAFQFIIESPQNNTGHKKRPRLVTSCDNCRLKKIKCLQPAPEAKCEACRAAKIQCKFKDRERYFAERSRAIAGPNAAASFGDNGQPNLFNNAPSLDAFAVASTSQQSHRNQRPNVLNQPGPYPLETHKPADQHYRAGSSSWETHAGHPGYTNTFHTSPPPTRQQHQQDASQSPLPLFEPRSSQYPYSTLMPHFIQVFFEKTGNEFSFLSYDTIIRDQWEGRLPPMLASCIAAMASRYTTIPDVTSRGVVPVVDAYANNAKRIFNSIAQLPTVDTLHALIILCWSEYKSIRSSQIFDATRQEDFRTYCQLAYRMAIDVGWTDQPNSALNLDETDRRRRQSTWASVGSLQMTANSNGALR